MKEGSLDRFNRIAPIYDRLATLVFGNAILQSQMENLELIPPHANVLVLGGGSGKWLNDLLVLNENCSVYFIEASSRMLERAKNNSNYVDRVTFIHGTQNDIPAIEFDVVITHFFLDMFSRAELEHFITQLKAILKPKGLWLVADFEETSLWHKILLNVMYSFFNLMGAMDERSLVKWNSVLRSKSFECVRSTSLFGDFIHSRIYTNGKS